MIINNLINIFREILLIRTVAIFLTKVNLLNVTLNLKTILYSYRNSDEKSFKSIGNPITPAVIRAVDTFINKYLQSIAE